MTRLEMLKKMSDVLISEGMDKQEAFSEAKYAITFVLQISVSMLYLQGDKQLSQQENQQLQYILQQRRNGEPLAYILGERYFMGIPFFVQPGVLIPRQETELLCEEVICKIKQENLQKVLDICTGSGCIGVSIAKFTNAKVCAADISPIAVAVAQKNANIHEVKIDIIQSDLFLNVQGKYDMITANPPYIDAQAYENLDRSVRDYEPALALQGGEDGLIFYRKIAEKASEYLNLRGYLVQEIGYDQADKVRNILLEAGFSNIQIKQDYAKLDRIVWAQWLG